jgi:hypothetical protein
MRTKGFSYRRVIARRDRIFAHALRSHIDTRLVGETVRDVTNDVAGQLPLTVSRDALFESIRVLAGTTLTAAAAKELSWRLAGNVDRLNEGQPVHAWARQIHDEAVPVRVERIQYAHKRDVHGWTLFCRALAGTPCPMVFPQFFSHRSCRAISKSLGFSAPWGRYPFSTPLYFVGLMFVANVEAEKSNETPYFKTISNTSGLLTQNRTKLEVRCRARPCPRGFQHQCDKCWLGYNECPAAIYPKSLVQRECVNCASISFFEPDDEGVICINCRTAQHNAR